MAPNPILGVVLHWIGGLAAASFYLPYRGVKRWSWETYWLVGGVFSWVIAPWIFAWILVSDLPSLFRSAPESCLGWAYFFGALWGLGGLTFGLTMRYLGIALGMAVALGYCAVFGTLMPPIFDGTFAHLFTIASGRTILLGVLICVTGIVISGLAGRSKEREVPDEEKRAVIREFNFPRGMAVATFSGILSSCMAYGIAAGKPLAHLAKVRLLANGGSDLWQNLPVLVIVLAGGFTTNFIWCCLLNIRNGSGKEYFGLQGPASEAASILETPTGRTATAGGSFSIPLLRNYLFAASAGMVWYLQFFFYSMGTTRMGKYDFSSWTLHMASIIIFSTLWGIALHEWRGSSRRTWKLMFTGLAVLVGSTVVVGYGNYLNVLSAR